MLTLIIVSLITASPSTLDSRLASAQSGDVIRLTPGKYPALAIRGRKWSPAITLDARGSTIATMRLDDVTGLHVIGGTFTGVPAPPNVTWARSISIEKGANLKFTDIRVEGISRRGFGLIANNVDGIIVENADFTNLHTAMGLNSTANAVVRNSLFHGLRSDGIDLVSVTDVLVEDNRFEDFKPVKPTGERGTPSFKDGDHPDAVQIWNNDVRPFGRDIVIRRNRVHGDTQGINTFGPQKDGYERISITDNVLDITHPAAISMIKCKDCEIIGNRASALPGAPYNVNIRTDGSIGRFCNNQLSKLPRHPTARRC